MPASFRNWESVSGRCRPLLLGLEGWWNLRGGPACLRPWAARPTHSLCDSRPWLILKTSCRFATVHLVIFQSVGFVQGESDHERTRRHTAAAVAAFKGSGPKIGPIATAPDRLQRLRIYSHSSLVYWWPLWVVGYLMNVDHLLARSGVPAWGEPETGVHPKYNPWMIFFLVLFLVLVITNFWLRGPGLGHRDHGAVLFTVLLAYVGWWDEVFGWVWPAADPPEPGSLFLVFPP